MSSQAKVAANRRNAKKSTGPRSEEGKAVVACNAIKHGLRAQQDVITGEDPAEYEASRRNVLAELGPVGHIETKLAERIVSLLWRLERAQRLQNGALDYLLTREIDISLAEYDDTVSQDDIEQMQGDPESDPRLIVGRVVVQDCLNGHVLDRLMLYERRIETGLSRAMNDLRKLRQERQASGRECQTKPTDAVARVRSVPVRACQETPYGVTTNASDRAEQSQALVEDVCSASEAVSYVAQPPSAGITAEGGRATRTDNDKALGAEQSQEGSQLLVAGCQQEAGKPAGDCEVRIVNSAGIAAGSSHAKGNCVKQSQRPRPAAVVRAVDRIKPHEVWHYHNPNRRSR